MPSMTREQIVRNILAHIQRHGSATSKWYVGITNDSEERLSVHNAGTNNAPKVYEAMNSRIAREAEQELLQNERIEGGTGGGRQNSKFVYTYRISALTREKV